MLSVAKNNRCQPAKPCGCSLIFVLSFYIVLFHLSICRNPPLSTLKPSIANVRKPFLLQKSFFGHANGKLALLFCLPSSSSCLVSVGRCQVAGGGAVPGVMRGGCGQQWLALVLATWYYPFWGDPMFLPATQKVMKAHVVQSFPYSFEAVVTAHKLHSLSHSSLEM